MLHESVHMAQIREQGESLGDLLTNLAAHSAGLVQDEFMLARQEIREKVSLYQPALLLLLLGGITSFIALLSLCAAFILWLGQHIEPWLAAAVTGLGLAVIGTIILLIARNEFGQLNLKPEQTLKTLEENKEWLKDMSQ